MAVPPPIPPADGLDIAAGKTALRTELRRARVAFAAETEAALRNEALVARLQPLLDRAGPIAGYVPHRGEPDIVPLLRRAHAQGITVALPYISKDQPMHFVVWHPDMALIAGPLGIPQPEGEAIVPAIVLTPLVGFDRGGHRLGQGAGYYDRWFAAHPHAKRIGIAWSVQEVPALPCDDWDVPLNAIVTEKDWIAL